MLTWIVRGALQHPRLILLATVFIIIIGTTVLTRSEVEVFPEFVPAQTSVQVEAPGLTAEQVERRVTLLVEQAIMGATGVAAVRSDSIQGLSVTHITFRDGEDPYRARQVVAESLSALTSRLPAGVAAPTLSPLTSSTMDLLKIGLVSDQLSPMALRDVAEWTVLPRLLAVPGVARATIFGGQLRRLEVQLDPFAMRARGLALADIIEAVRAATEVRGGGFVDTASQRILIEPRGSSTSPAELANAVVKPAAAPIRLQDVARVLWAATPAFGDALIMGHAGVLISTSSQFGANTLATTRRVEHALAELRPALEAQGIKLYPALHRPANFIETALAGINTDLLLGVLFIIVVLIVFTHDWRAALIAFISIPLSLLTALLLLDFFGQIVNTMTLGGLAVALGVVIDDAVIGIENILRRLREHTTGSAQDIVLAASVEVREPVVYATFVLALTMLPVILLTGLQGAFFAPLGLAFLLATLASLLIAITLTPALALLFLARRPPRAEPRLLGALRRAHARALAPLCRRPQMVLVATVFIGVLAVVCALQMGNELLPSFRERHYVLQVNGPPGASIDWMRNLGTRLAKDLLAIPAVATVEQQIGRAAAAEDTFPPNQSEFHVELQKVNGTAEDRALASIREVLASYPGIQSEALTFLGDRIGESLSGETAAIVIGAYGPDLDVLDEVANDLASVVRATPGAIDVQVKTPPGTALLAIALNATDLVSAGINASDALDAIAATYQGLDIAEVNDGQRTAKVTVTVPAPIAADPEAAGNILVRGRSALVPLSRLAEIGIEQGRSTISHAGGRRRQVVTANAADADIAGLVARIKTNFARDVRLPQGVYVEFSGAAQGAAAARRELLINVAYAAVGIIVLLIQAFGGWRPAALILAGVPAALAGGVAMVFLGNGVVSLGGLVGFVTLFGITARNAILLIAHGDYLVTREGTTWGLQTMLRASGERLAPILMTALVTALGMLPLGLASGEAGREVQGPMALVILGGLATSTLFSLLLLPPLVLAFRQRSASPHFSPGGQVD